jgi:uncharacterized protein (DUF4415 family)
MKTHNFKPIYPTDEEEALINKGIAEDQNTHELDENWHRQAKSAKEFFLPEVYKKLVALKRPRGRPKAPQTKIYTAIRFDLDVLNAFKADGKGWQTRINQALKEYLSEHSAK